MDHPHKVLGLGLPGFCGCPPKQAVKDRRDEERGRWRFARHEVELDSTLAEIRIDSGIGWRVSLWEVFRWEACLETAGRCPKVRTEIND